jgi:voltage-gated potassium channel
MRYLKQDSPPALDQERSEILQQLENWLETPMLVLGIIWLGLFVVELVWGLNPLLEALGITIWIAFIVDFGIKVLLAPRRMAYLQHHWLLVLSLFIPALQTLRILRILQPLQSVHAVRGLQLLQVMTRTNKGMRMLAISIGRRGFGYVIGATTIVTLMGAAGIYAFEHESPTSSAVLRGNGITDYAAALWWTAMVMTTIGSDYFPQTAEGRVLCFLLSLYAVGVCGYVTATLATFFVSQDAESEVTERVETTSIQALQSEVTALRADIQALSRSKLT